MNKYQNIFENGDNIEASILLNDIQSLSDWESLYWASKILTTMEDSQYDREIIDSLEQAYFLGLNINSNRELFFDSLQIIAKLYFQYRDYELACNKFMLLTENVSDLPYWVHLNYVSAQIHTDNLIRIADEPTFFFKRLDYANLEQKKEVEQRNYVFREFLNLLVDRFKDEKTDVSTVEIIEKGLSYRLNNSEELIRFKEIFLPTYDIPVLEDVITEATKQPETNDRVIELEALVAELLKKQEELLEVIKTQKTDISALTTAQTSVDDIKEENIRLKDQLATSAEKLEKVQKELEEAKTTVVPAPDVVAHDLLGRNKKILVLGGTEVKEHHLRGIAKQNSGFKNEDIEFVLEYDKIKTYSARIHPWSCAYAGIIIGPCPHKTGESGDYSSLIQKLKEEEGYPHVEECRDASGSLKISNSSFRQALNRMVLHLQSTNIY